ncbi:hypothetical protein [Ahrensia sp. R2A130]|uniref:hypothetical protein n=1 Tax=Ahrensia sp. R2A130 TaxID=744979 RepID=UPI0001E0BC70|nr:hypothetical protein [Ahrensia sp. R2A130]EFL89442.1 conserved hypothetical protein [Ahrensia sp. R2A130]
MNGQTNTAPDGELVHTDDDLGKAPAVWATGTFWTVLGTLVGVAGLLITAYLFSITSASNYRAYKGQLAMEAHTATIEFVAAFTQHYRPDSAREKKDLAAQKSAWNRLHPAVRIASITSDGAIARASVVDDIELKACLQRFRTFHFNLVERVVPEGENISLENYAIALAGFPDMVRRYVENVAQDPTLVGRDTGGGQRSCPLLNDVDGGNP